MRKEELIAELKAATASLVTATAAAENDDWALVEQTVMDADHRLSDMMKAIAINLLATDSTENVIPANEAKIAE